MMKKTESDKNKKVDSDSVKSRVDELTLDLQRIMADFDNYRKRVEQEKDQARAAGKMSAILNLLPVIDDIERAISHVPDDLKNNNWAQGIINLSNKLEGSLKVLGLVRIEASPGTAFTPELHEALGMDEGAEGDHEVISEELRAGYLLDGQVVRPSMVQVTRE
jgi:molecular chaperone GrpE